ncbi:MAG TPA: IS21 family transposase [Thermodesulfovibrionales bacterium]|nr:IS21 family transposase [Thermodesulfovibrionales bacterium]
MAEDVRQRIQYLRDVMHLSFYQIEDMTGVPRKRASKIYQGDNSGNKASRPCKLKRYRSLIGDWFADYPALKAKQVYGMLKDRGMEVSYSLVVKYTRSFRQKKEKVYHALTFLPGEESQVDWCFINHPSLGKLSCFVLILSHSRYLFAHVFPRASFEFFIEGHLMAFSSMKGTTRSLRFDNLRTVVLRRRPDVEFNPHFLGFCRHYGIEIRLCNPGAGNEKGRVERVIRTMKEMYFNKLQNYSSFEALNSGLHEWVDHKNRTVHRATEQRPIDLLKEERLKALPEIPWNNVVIHPPVKTTKTGMMIFDTNSYSVPDYLVGKSLSIHSTPDMVRIYDSDKQVASHPRSFQRYKQFLNPLHRSYCRISQKAKMQRIHEVIKNMHPAMSDFLLRNQTCGEDPCKTAHEIFRLMKGHSRGMLISIASECLKRKSPRLKTFLSYLETGPSETVEIVSPQNGGLLNITYKPRSLEVYDDETES